MEQNEFVYHICRWYWGKSINIVKVDGTAMVCVKFDEKSFPMTGYICDLSVVESERMKGIGRVMMRKALLECRAHEMTFARLHVDANNVWLRAWYERWGFKELSRDDNEIELIKEL